jgi:hypothetical protein
MTRNPNTNAYGYSFCDQTIDSVWNKAIPVPGLSPDFRRKDRFGAYIDRAHFGNTEIETGWEIDHTKPVTLGGNDDLFNLQPLQWRTNRIKGNDFPYTP